MIFQISSLITVSPFLGIWNSFNRNGPFKFFLDNVATCEGKFWKSQDDLNSGKSYKLGKSVRGRWQVWQKCPMPCHYRYLSAIASRPRYPHPTLVTCGQWAWKEPTALCYHLPPNTHHRFQLVLRHAEHILACPGRLLAYSLPLHGCTSFKR